MKKVLAMLLSLTLVVTLTIGGSIAYLQDSDSDVNVMTLGNVTIEQHEQEWDENETELKDFTDDKPLYPYVGTLGWENKDKDNDAYRRFTMNNVVDKYVTVENTGKSDAYVRTIIALEMGEFTYEEFDKIGISINKVNGDEFKFPGAWNWTDDFVTEINGNKYNIMVAVHENPLPPKDDDDTTDKHITIPSLLQVYMDKTATNDDCEKLDGNKNGKYDILVLSQAVQSAGFEAADGNSAAQVALDTAFGAANETNVKKWFGDVISEEEENQFVQNYARRSYAIDTANMTDADITKAARMLKENNACDSLIVNGEMTEEQQVVLADALDGMADDSVVIVLNDNDTIADELKKHNAVEYAFDKTGFVKEGNNYVIGSAEGLKAWRAEKKGDVSLKADITLPETNWQPINIFNSEDPFVFDGEGHTIYNMNITDGSADAGFFGSCVGDIKNLNFEDINLKTSGRSAIVAAKLYGDIENCHVKNAVIEDSYWATGVIAGLYNAGDIKNCTVTNVTVKSNGGTGGIVGVINETSGTRTVENCHVIDSTVHNTGVYGEAYSGGGIVGMVNISNSTVNITGCSTKNVKLEGQHIFEICGPVDNDITLNID